MNLAVHVLYRPERLARAQAAIAALGWQAAFLEGPPALSAAEAAARWPSWVAPDCGLPGGQIACHVGHAEILALVRDQRPTLVLEDDFVPSFPDVEARIDRIVAEAARLGIPWDYINLGRCYGAGGDPALGWEGVTSEVGLCGHAALIAPAGARRLLAEPLRDRPTDWIARDLAARGELRGFAASPRLFAQERRTLPSLCGNLDDMPEFQAVEAPDDWRAIPGWFAFANAYRELVEDLPADTPSIVVELGAWKGRSTAFLAAAIARSGKPIYLHTVDGFAADDVEGEGLPPASAEDVALGTLRAVFDRNLAPLAQLLGERFTVHQGDSAATAALFADGSVAAVWVDAGHAYEEVLADLRAWWPKVRAGGMIGGDDWAWPTVRQAVEWFFNDREVRVEGEYPYWLVEKGDADG